MKKTKIIVMIYLSFLIKLQAVSPYELVNLYTPNGSVVEARLYEEDLDEYEQFMFEYNTIYSGFPEIILLADATNLYNCHGFTWSISEGGPVSGLEMDFSAFWTDGSYEETTEELAEKIFYGAVHSAVKSNTHPGMYVSKWGNGPLVVHPPDLSPYERTEATKYYRLKCLSEINNRVFTSDDVNIYSRCNMEIKNTSVESGAGVVVASGLSIRLLPGFHIKAGGKFEARIKPYDFNVDNPILPNESTPPMQISSVLFNQKAEDAELIHVSAFRENINYRGGAQLYQNIPNPAHDGTIIPFYLPSDVIEAKIQVISATGFPIKNILLSERGEGETTVEVSELQEGLYFYTLTVDGKVIETKRMLVLK